MNININPNSELHQSIVNVPDMVQVPEMWVDQARQFQQAMRTIRLYLSVALTNISFSAGL